MKLNNIATLITGVTPDYTKKLKLTAPTWAKKTQFKDISLLVFCAGYDKPERDLNFLNDYYKNVKYIKWSMKVYENQRELILSAFVLAAAKYVNTIYSIKIDVDCAFVGEEDIFFQEDLQYDVVSHRWGYTKPAWWINKMEGWAPRLTGMKPLFKDIPWSNSNTYSAKRIQSFVCLQKTNFIQEIANYAGERLPCPSHDTYIWYMASLLPWRNWRSRNMKKLSVFHCHNYKRLQQKLQEYN